MKTLSISDINNIIVLLQQKRYEYRHEYVGTICSGTGEGDNGMYHYVMLDAYDEDKAYVKHIVKIGDYSFYCHEYDDSPIEWYLGKELLTSDEDSNFKKLIDNLNSIIIPFNFEQYAIESFDPDAIAEAVPYGKPHCLIIDNCTFIVEDEDETIDERKVKSILKEHNWTDNRIDRAIEEGYEYTPNVFDSLCELPIVYLRC